MLGHFAPKKRGRYQHSSQRVQGSGRPKTADVKIRNKFRPLLRSLGPNGKDPSQLSQLRNGIPIILGPKFGVDAQDKAHEITPGLKSSKPHIGEGMSTKCS